MSTNVTRALRFPSVVKAVKGTDREGPGRRNHQEPQLKVELPEPPDWLTTKEAEHYVRVGRMLVNMRVMTAADVEALAFLSQRYQEFLDARGVITREGSVLSRETQYGEQRYKNPAMSIQTDAWKSVMSYLTTFGLTPGSRGAIKALPESGAQGGSQKWR